MIDLCPICWDDLHPLLGGALCVTCGTSIHITCAEERGGCPLGCTRPARGGAEGS